MVFKLHIPFASKPKQNLIQFFIFFTIFFQNGCFDFQDVEVVQRVEENLLFGEVIAKFADGSETRHIYTALLEVINSYFVNNVLYEAFRRRFR